MAANNVGHKIYGIWKSRYWEAQKRVEERTNIPAKPYRGSKYRDAGMLRGVAEDIGEDELIDLINWYFDNKSIHDFTQFIFNYDKLMRERDRRRKDREYRERLFERTRARMEEIEEEDR